MTKINKTIFALFLSSAFALLVAVSCDSGNANKCPVGSEGCDCTKGGTCDLHLECLSNTCVYTAGRDKNGINSDSAGAGGAGSAGGTAGGAGGAGGSGGTGGECTKDNECNSEDLEICEDNTCGRCFDFFCEEEFDVCYNNSSCRSIVTCSADCSTDSCAETCVNKYPNGTADLIDLMECFKAECKTRLDAL